MNLKKLLGEGASEQALALSKNLAALEKQQRNLQILLQRQQLQNTDIPSSDFHAQGFGIHSKQDEDGLILHILNEIGTTNRTFFEIGVQNGLECNTANLARNLGWNGVMLEGSPELADVARKNYCGFPGVTIKHTFVNKTNINSLLQETNADLNCDLFSLDIDGNDYWIWDAMENFNPRVVVVEYNHALGSERAVTIPYDENFIYRAKNPRGYFGASLRALQKLGAKKGYVLVGSSNLGPNAFFVRKDQLKGSIKEMSVEDAYRPLYIKRRGDSFPETLKDMDFQEV